jgi:hypothetical protein
MAKEPRPSSSSPRVKPSATPSRAAASREPAAPAPASRAKPAGVPAKVKTGATRTIECYLCGRRQDVSVKALSTNCPGCNKAIRIEDLVVNTYTPVNDLETCGRIVVTKKGRVAAKRIRAGDGIECEGTLHGAVETPGDVTLGAKAEWKGATLRSRRLVVTDGVKLEGRITVPWAKHGDAGEPSAASTKSASGVSTSR